MRSLLRGTPASTVLPLRVSMLARIIVSVLVTESPYLRSCESSVPTSSRFTLGTLSQGSSFVPGVIDGRVWDCCSVKTVVTRVAWS